MDNFYYDNPRPMSFEDVTGPADEFQEYRENQQEYRENQRVMHNHSPEGQIQSQERQQRQAYVNAPNVSNDRAHQRQSQDRYAPSSTRHLEARYSPSNNNPNFQESNPMPNEMSSERRFNITPVPQPNSTIHQPATYIIEENEATVVQIELFGVKDKDFQVKIMGNNLIVEGKKDLPLLKQKSKQAAKIYFMGPVWHGEFKRVIALEYVLDPSLVSAQFNNGLLTLTVKKPKSHKTEFVKVNVTK